MSEKEYDPFSCGLKRKNAYQLQFRRALGTGTDCRQRLCWLSYDVCRVFMSTWFTIAKLLRLPIATSLWRGRSRLRSRHQLGLQVAIWPCCLLVGYDVFDSNLAIQFVSLLDGNLCSLSVRG